MAIRRFHKGKSKAERKADDDLLTRINRWISEGADFCKDIHDKSEENNSYIAGNTQWSEGDMQRQMARERPAMPMNKILQVLNSVANREIMQRYVTKVYGRDRSPEDSGWADVANEWIRWQADQCHAEHEESMAFRSMAASGYSCLHFYYDSMEDEGRGLIVTEEVPIWWMLWDSRARKQNLVDRRWHVCGKYVPKDEAEQEYGDASASAKRLFKNMNDNSKLSFDGYEAANSSVTGSRWPWDAVASGRWYNKADDEVFMVEVEWRDIKVQYKAAVPVNFDAYVGLLSDPMAQVYAIPDQESGEMQIVTELPPEVEQQLQQIEQQMAQDPAMAQDPSMQGQDPLALMGIQAITGDQFAQMGEQQQEAIRSMLFQETELKVYETTRELDDFAVQYRESTGEEFRDFAKQKRYVHKYAVLVSDQILDQGERPQGWTFEFLTGFPKASREATTFFGIVDVGKAYQDYRNSFMSLALARFAHSPKAPLIIEEGAVDDPDEFLDQLSNPRGAVFVPDGFISGNRMIQLPAPTFPTMERELIEMADQGVNEVAGLSGLDTGAQQDLRRVSGTVVQSVKDASNTILAILFDSLRRYRKRNGKLLLRMMQEFYTPEQVARIVGAEIGQFVPQGEPTWPEIERFDITIDEAPTSVSERMEFFDFLTRTGTLENWMNQGLLPPDLPFEWVPFLSESDRQKIKAFQQQKQQQQDVQVQMQQLLDQLSQSQDPATRQAVQQAQQQLQQMQQQQAA